MRLPLPLVALLALVALSASSSLGAPPGPPVTRSYAWDVTAVACPGVGDGVCLAYDGRIPGPTLDVNLGDTVRITLTNRIAQTLPPGAPAHLAQAAVSFHVHGTSISASLDGVAEHPGTNLVASYAPPNGSFTYEFRAAFPGAWHYHDHVLGADGSEGSERGLYGGLVVRGGAQARPDVVLDLHAHDSGVNLGRGVQQGAAVAPGDDVDLLVVGLGDRVWQVRVSDPSGAPAWSGAVGPGVSELVRLRDVQAGAYAWRAHWGPLVHEGTVVVR